MKKRTYYELQLNAEERDALDEAHQHEKLCVIEDPWRGTKAELEDGWIRDVLEDEHGLPPKIEETVPHLKAVLEQVKDLKDDDEILMVIGL